MYLYCTFKKLSTRTTLLNVVYAAMGVMSTISCGQSTIHSDQEPKGVAIAQLSIGESGISYANLDIPEVLPIGPGGIYSVQEGYAISDNVNGKIILLDGQFVGLMFAEVHRAFRRSRKLRMAL